MRAAVIAAVTASLAACGGGGGGGSGSGVASEPVLPTTFSVSGQIQIAANDYVDKDTADVGPGVFLARNNSETSPQLINNPATIGGYVSAIAGDYPSAPGLDIFSYVADSSDYYRVSMIDGQEISLKPDRASDSLPASRVRQSLAVWKVVGATLEMVATSFASGNPVKHQVTSSGEYLIRIEEAEGPSNYTLTVGEFSTGSLETARSAGVPAGARFVIGEALVTFAKPSAYSAASARNSVAASIMSSQSIVAIEPMAESSDTNRVTFDMSGNMSAAAASTSGRSGAEQETLQRIAELRTQPGILHAEPNFIRKATEVPNVTNPSGTNPLQQFQWHYDSINLTPAWDLGDGLNATVAVLDTGIYRNHVEFAGQTETGCDFVSNLNSSLDGDGVDNDPTDPGDSQVGKSSFHGTHVAGTIAAADNSNGGVGVAFRSKIVPMRVLGKNGEGSDFDIARAIRYAAGLEDVIECGPRAAVDIINLSLGSAGDSQTLRSAVKAAFDVGVIVVAAAGNDSTASAFYPAGYDETISVGAVGLDLIKAPYSNFGSTLSLVAPGGNMQQDLNNDTYGDGVLSSWVDDGGSAARATYSFMQGTSMAAPHVSGVLALVQGYRRTNEMPLFSPSDIMEFIKTFEFTRDLGEPQRDDAYGYGIIDAVKAMSIAADSNAKPTPVVRSNKSNFSFTVSGSADLVLDIPNSVTSLEAVAVTADSIDWLILSDNGDDNPATYTVLVDGMQLADGVSYPGMIKVTYVSTDATGLNVRNRTLNIPVSLEIPDPNIASDAGRHYVLLINTVSGEAVQDVVEARNGVYDFAFTDVPVGEYQIYAGSDIDNDGSICDLGEACAAFPIRNLPDTIVLNGNRDGLNFQTSFEKDITAEGSSSDERISSILSGKGIKRLRAGETSQNSQRVRQLDAD